MNSIEKLVALLPPPKSPAANFVDWSMVEGKVGFIFPSDYKEFIRLYGSGSIAGFFWIINPGDRNKAMNSDKADYFLWAYSDLKSQFPEDYIRPAFPEGGSFYPWGFTDNGNCLAWHVFGRSEDWRVVLFASDPDIEDAFEFSFSEFLVELLSGRLSSPIISGDFSSHSVFRVSSRAIPDS